MSDQTQRRKPGAPLGNTNAVKHGYYASALHNRSLEKLPERFHPTGLAVEKRFISLLFKRIEKQFEETISQKPPAERHIHILATSLYLVTHLLHTRGIINGVIDEEIEIALAEVIDEIKAAQTAHDPNL